MKLHHIGKVVEDLEKEIEYYKNTFGMKITGKPVIDPIQKVEVAFVDVGYGKDLTIELIRPTTNDSPVQKFLKDHGGGIHHLCFEVKDLTKASEEFRSKGALILGNSVPGKGHDDRLTLWLYTKEKELVELVEEDK